MLLQWALLLEDPFADATMTKLEEAVSACPPHVALFDTSAWPDYHWAEELEGVARVAARCCAHKPEDRPTIFEVSSMISAEIESARSARPQIATTNRATIRVGV